MCGAASRDKDDDLTGHHCLRNCTLPDRGGATVVMREPRRMPRISRAPRLAARPSGSRAPTRSGQGWVSCGCEDAQISRFGTRLRQCGGAEGMCMLSAGLVGNAARERYMS